MMRSFFSRFLVFTAAFYAGCVLCLTVLTVVKTAVFFHDHFWRALGDWMRFDVVPIALAELFRSPIMGLLFALVGKRYPNSRGVRDFGLVCGLLSYALGDFLTILGTKNPDVHQIVADYNLVEITLLGLPVAMIICSRWYKKAEPSSTSEKPID